MNILNQLHLTKVLFQESTLYALINILITLIIAFCVNSLLRSFITVPKRLDTRRGRTYVAVTRNIITVIIFGIALYIVLIILNINVAPLLASAGIVGLTIGVGSRSLVEDLIAGFFLLSQDTLSIGDYVNISGTNEGTVEDIGFRTLRLRGANGALTIIPNGQVKQVVNYSRGKSISYLDIPVKAGQKVSIDEIYTILNGIINHMEENKETDYHLLPESKVLGIQNIAAGSALMIRVVLTTTANKDMVEREFRYQTMKAFEKKNIMLA